MLCQLLLLLSLPAFARGDRVESELAARVEEAARLREEFAKIPEDLSSAEFVKKKLAHLAQVDQHIRNAWLESTRKNYAHDDKQRSNALYNLRIMEVDAANTAELKRLLERYDWITIERFGAEADQNAWLVAQHADLDTAFQKDVLARLERYQASGGTSPSNYAYLHDRVAVAEGRPQRYATQGGCEEGRWTPLPVEDEEKLESRRAALKLGPMQEYVKSNSRGC